MEMTNYFSELERLSNEVKEFWDKFEKMVI